MPMPSPLAKKLKPIQLAAIIFLTVSGGPLWIGTFTEPGWLQCIFNVIDDHSIVVGCANHLRHIGIKQHDAGDWWLLSMGEKSIRLALGML